MKFSFGSQNEFPFRTKNLARVSLPVALMTQKQHLF